MDWDGANCVFRCAPRNIIEAFPPGVEECFSKGLLGYTGSLNDTKKGSEVEVVCYILPNHRDCWDRRDGNQVTAKVEKFGTKVKNGEEATE